MPIRVVAALLWRAGRLLICQRKDTDAFPGQWEFPGGKLEPGEMPRAALARELVEELGIRARIGDEIAWAEHQYPGGSLVHLLFFAVSQFEGECENRVFKQILWAHPHELDRFDFLEADRPLVERLVAGEISPPAN
ncbi:MAG: (deoxy)nucleoside triphosphate pyrophosphohydrolase [Acidobacteria bacterium]|nr:(deoxy)nucleoside triphosphate pyrophosphohydrolase [Acidobacteriota bacterium]